MNWAWECFCCCSYLHLIIFPAMWMLVTKVSEVCIQKQFHESVITINIYFITRKNIYKFHNKINSKCCARLNNFSATLLCLEFCLRIHSVSSCKWKLLWNMCKRRNQLSVGATIKSSLQQVKTFAKNLELNSEETETDRQRQIWVFKPTGLFIKVEGKHFGHSQHIDCGREVGVAVRGETQTISFIHLFSQLHVL